MAMLFKPAPLSHETLDAQVLIADKKACRRFGPCGVGEKALYLNSFYIDRRYYVPFTAIRRVFKRVAMSRGGFTGKGVFASIPYLVVEYDDGTEKQCNFKHEEQVDQLLAYVGQKHPGLPLLSRAAEEKLAEKALVKAARLRPVLSESAKAELSRLQAARDHLEQAPQLTLELSQANRRKRAFLQSSPAWRWVALAITLLGVGALALAVGTFLKGETTRAVYFTLFGVAAIFLFSGMSVLPTAKNNKKAVLARADKACKETELYIKNHKDFPLPARYAHPFVLDYMIGFVEEGKAQTCRQALELTKQYLKSLNNTVQVEQEEYDRVVAIKPLFLNENYR